ncbi:hypothetical protein C2845_PM16G13330 [Panicum miliaceum]|uniref:GRF-type domain-containing protein n=1 Tax=Panicum miliaceum TaxID=4540 RepID=A0A3L6PWU2_PANMI|nr:hypothetical protein C2845_PM16G13330 [Panicum miliaceum]
MEISYWGGLDHVTDPRCSHGKRPRRLLCWDGKNTGRRYLGCPMEKKSQMCCFVKWMDEEWPPRFPGARRLLLLSGMW